jgi:hypothetical protein
MDTNGKILSLKGQPIGSATPAVNEETLKQPTTHEPRWFRRIVEAADQHFARLYEQALGDLNAPKSPGTTVDEEQVVRHYQQLWAQYAQHILKSSEPITLNVQAMKEQIEASVNIAKHKARMAQPLHQVADYTEWDFRLVGQCLNGAVWMNSHCVISVGEGGMVRVWLTDVTTPQGIACDNLLSRCEILMPSLQAVGMSMQTVYNLLGAYGVNSTAAPTEQELMVARDGIMNSTHRN